MSKGEKAKITIEPDWAYGAKGTFVPDYLQGFIKSHMSVSLNIHLRHSWHDPSQLEADLRSGVRVNFITQQPELHPCLDSNERTFKQLFFPTRLDPTSKPCDP
jgi:hypothetical protein